jgi:membrane protease YdiL (CAAX protease family)
MPKDNNSTLHFFAWVFILSIPFWIYSAANPVEILPGLPVSALGAFTPAVAAMIVIYRTDRFSGVLKLLRRSFDIWRVTHYAWLFVILLVNPIIALMAYGYMQSAGTTLPTPQLLTFTVIPMFIVFFIAGLGEELGWTGYATELLGNRLGVIATGISIGSVWAVWHFIPLLQAHRPVEWIAWWSLGTISLRIIMVWLYAHSGKSVAAIAVFHALTNLCWQLFPVHGSHYDPQKFGLISFGIAMIALIAQQIQRKTQTQIA